MTESPEVLFEIKGHIATITLNRPDRMNTISPTMLNELVQHLLCARQGSRMCAS